MLTLIRFFCLGADLDADPACHAAASADVVVAVTVPSDVVVVDCFALADKPGAADYTANAVTVMLSPPIYHQQSVMVDQMDRPYFGLN